MLPFWATMSKQRSTLSKGRNFNAKLVRHCCCFWQQSRTLLRHCCWCWPGLRPTSGWRLRALPRDGDAMIARYMLSTCVYLFVCLFVRPSVTKRSFTKTAKRRTGLYLLIMNTGELLLSSWKSTVITSCCKTVIRPVTEYACAVWHSSITAEQHDHWRRYSGEQLGLCLATNWISRFWPSYNDIQLLADRRDRQMRQLFTGMHDPSHCLHRLLLGELCRDSHSHVAQPQELSGAIRKNKQM